MTDLSPDRFGALADDELRTRGLWQYAHYYDPVTSADEAPAQVALPAESNSASA